MSRPRGDRKMGFNGAKIDSSGGFARIIVLLHPFQSSIQYPGITINDHRVGVMITAVIGGIF